jgi:hypothetical protein
MLRIAVCGELPTELEAVLRYLFSDFFEIYQFGALLVVGKVFLEVLLTADDSLIDIYTPFDGNDECKLRSRTPHV